MKQKTHSGAKKRFKATGSKKKTKIVGRKASARHLLINKSKRQKKMRGKTFDMEKGDSKNIKKLLNL
jgi:large subunit ribosomal protein L35